MKCKWLRKILRKGCRNVNRISGMELHKYMMVVNASNYSSRV
jgi:hypothetical protein